jgi:hypothetical protein
MCGASAHGYVLLGFIVGPVFHRYGEGYRFANLACDLVDKHGFITYQAKVHHAMALVAFWTQPIGTAIDLTRAAFRTAIETGDLTFACYAMYQTVTDLLLRNDPLDEVWRESEMALDFTREAKYGDAAQVVVSQQRFIATMQGRTATFFTFSDSQFDEATFEVRLTGIRMPLMICLYWILKLQARFLAGDYVAALAASQQAKPRLVALIGEFKTIDYFYYTALTVAALYENGSADEQAGWRELLTAHQEQLREWVESYPPTSPTSTRWCRLRSPASRGVTPTQCACTKRPFDPPTITASCRTRRWPMRSPRGSTPREASRGSRMSVCGMRDTAISSGARTAR